MILGWTTFIKSLSNIEKNNKKQKYIRDFIRCDIVENVTFILTDIVIEVYIANHIEKKRETRNG